MLSEKISQEESYNNKLKGEVINLRAEIHKRKKLEDETTLLRATILDQHEKLYDVKMECFDKVKKMVDKVKMIEKYLNIVSQTHQRIINLQEKIIELEGWRSTEKNIPSSLPTIKIYDIMVYSMAIEEFQGLASRFEENSKKDLARMMNLYEKSMYDIQRYIQCPRSISRKKIQFQLPCSSKLKVILKKLRRRLNPRRIFQKKISKRSS